MKTVICGSNRRHRERKLLLTPLIRETCLKLDVFVTKCGFQPCRDIIHDHPLQWSTQLTICRQSLVLLMATLSVDKVRVMSWSRLREITGDAGDGPAHILYDVNLGVDTGASLQVEKGGARHILQVASKQLGVPTARVLNEFEQVRGGLQRRRDAKKAERRRLMRERDMHALKSTRADVAAAKGNEGEAPNASIPTKNVAAPKATSAAAPKATSAAAPKAPSAAAPKAPSGAAPKDPVSASPKDPTTASHKPSVSASPKDPAAPKATVAASRDAPVGVAPKVPNPTHKAPNTVPTGTAMPPTGAPPFHRKGVRMEGAVKRGRPLSPQGGNVSNKRPRKRTDDSQPVTITMVLEDVSRLEAENKRLQHRVGMLENKLLLAMTTLGLIHAKSDTSQWFELGTSPTY
jgi:hypothetical protein